MYEDCLCVYLCESVFMFVCVSVYINIYLYMSESVGEGREEREYVSMSECVCVIQGRPYLRIWVWLRDPLSGQVCRCLIAKLFCFYYRNLEVLFTLVTSNILLGVVPFCCCFLFKATTLSVFLVLKLKPISLILIIHSCAIVIDFLINSCFLDGHFWLWIMTFPLSFYTLIHTVVCIP